MVGRMKELLALGSMLEFLQRGDVIEALDLVTARTDWYIPTLQFLMRPDNRKPRFAHSSWLEELTCLA